MLQIMIEVGVRYSTMACALPVFQQSGT